MQLKGTSVNVRTMHTYCALKTFFWVNIFQNLQRFLVSTNFGHCSVLYPSGRKGQLMCFYSNKHKGEGGGGEERERGRG